MAQDATYMTNVYHRVTDGDGKHVSGMTVGTPSGAIFIEYGGAIRGTDSATMSCLSDFNFGIRQETTTAIQMKNYLMGRNYWSVKDLSANVLQMTPDATDSSPPIIPSHLGYLFISLAKAVNNHQLSLRLAKGYQGEELVIALRGLAESTVVTIFFSCSNLASPTVIGTSYGSVLKNIRIQCSAASHGFLRLVCPEDGTWAVVDGGISRSSGVNSGGNVIEVPV